LFALLYGGDSGGRDTYVTFAGHELDAGVAGAIAVLLALLLLAAVPLLKRDRPLTRL
jgi:hypothetical protein